MKKKEGFKGQRTVIIPKFIIKELQKSVKDAKDEDTKNNMGND